jgi:hypothetical protein
MQKSIALFLIINAVASSACAGAWLQPAGNGLFIVQASSFASDAYYNRSGDKASQARYLKYELQPYLEYGAGENLTVGGTAYWQYANQAGAYNYGIADPEIFLRTRLWIDEKQIVSLQPLIKFKTLYDETLSPRGGSSSTDSELSLLYGRNILLLSPHDYLDIRVGYRHRSTELNDQIRADVSLGLGLTESWKLIPAIRTVAATEFEPSNDFTENGNQDYNLVKLELGASYVASSRHIIGVTLFNHVSGKQVGDGRGLSLSISHPF